MAEKISMRFQTPADAQGKRKDIHPYTTTDEVIVDAAGATPSTLTSKLSDMLTLKISPTKPDKPCLWGKVIQ